MEKNASILVVDDDKEIADLVEIYLVNDGYQVLKASDGVYICLRCYQRSGSLLNCHSTLTCMHRRYISVALALESPPPDVIRHPAL